MEPAAGFGYHMQEMLGLLLGAGPASVPRQVLYQLLSRNDGITSLDDSVR